MAKFKTAIKGYDKKEVDQYLHKTTEYHESRLRELEECIKRLREENDYLYSKNSEYHRNEERVSDAILKAMEVKSELEKEHKRKIALEEDRLRIFKSKWIAYARGIDHANADRIVADIEGYLEEFRKEFTQKAIRDLDVEEGEPSVAEKSYRKEKARLAALTREKEEKMSAVSLEKCDSEEDDADNKPIGFYEE